MNTLYKTRKELIAFCIKFEQKIDLIFFFKEECQKLPNDAVILERIKELRTLNNIIKDDSHVLNSLSSKNFYIRILDLQNQLIDDFPIEDPKDNFWNHHIRDEFIKNNKRFYEEISSFNVESNKDITKTREKMKISYDSLFSLCVDLLIWLADKFHTTYVVINIWIFCIIWPVITIILLVLVLLK